MRQQETVKIPIHSLIDLITNSSTEIFIDCEGSVKPAKELLTELLKINGSDKTCDDVFEVMLEKDEDNIRNYLLHLEYYDKDSYEKYKKYEINKGTLKEQDKKLDKLIEDYKKGTTDIRIDSYYIQKHLVIKSKDKKYNHLMKLLKKFLYSPEHYEFSTD